MQINERECEAGGKDVKAITALAHKLEAIGREMHKQGVYLFGGAGSGSLRCSDGENDRPLVLASFGQGFDGGDGACDDYGPDGLMRGE